MGTMLKNLSPCCPCFLCSSPATVEKGSKELLKGNLQGRRSNRSVRKTAIFLKYLLDFRKPRCYTLITEVLHKLAEEDQGNGGETIEFCDECRVRIEQVVELHRELEVVQMKIVEVARSMRRKVVGVSNVKQENGGECGGGLELQKRFQVLVAEEDAGAVSLPLVYLRRVEEVKVPTKRSSHWTASRDLIKTEMEETPSEDFDPDFTCDLSETDSLSNAFPNHIVTKKRKRNKPKPRLKPSKETLHPEPSPAVLLRSKLIKKKREADGIAFKLRKTATKTGRPVRKCQSCSFSTTSFQGDMEAHLRSQHETPEKNFECPDCSLGFTTQQYFEVHLMLHGGTWKCDVCEEEVVPILMKKHLEETHSNAEQGATVYICKYCDHPYGTLTAFVTHVGRHRNATVSCPLCPSDRQGKSYSARSELCRHLYNAHGLEEYLFKCDRPDCSLTFSYPDALREHKKRHDATFSCPTCEVTFLHEKALQAHILNMHTDHKPFRCEDCPSRFKYAGSLETHRMKEHGARKFECHVCAKTFFSLKCQELHMWSKHKIGDKDGYPCHLCPKVYYSAYLLRMHQEVHSESKNYACETCGYTSKTLVMFKRHRATHEAKKFACTYCDKKFTLKWYLDQHLRIHTGTKPFQCEFCAMAFAQKSGLNSHRRNRHSQQIEEEHRVI